MPISAQITRLIVANALTPPYAALEAPFNEILHVASAWNLDFHGDFSEEAAALEALLGDASNRLFLRNVLKRVGSIGSTQILSDCCWKVTAHDCFTSRVLGRKCSSEDADHVLIAKRTTGECAIVFQQGNDQNEFSNMGIPKDVFQDFVPFSLRGSKRDVTVWENSRREYVLATNASIARDFISSVSSGECSRVYIAGFSFGGLLAQMFRADYGTPNANGMLTKTCTFGNRTVECSLNIVGSIYAFYNSTVEVEHDTDDSLFITEDDLLSELPEGFRTGVYCPSCPTDIRAADFRDILPYSRIRGMRTFQLRRDLGITFSPMRFKVHAEAVELPRGVSTQEWQRNQSYIDRNESYTNGLLGTLSHPDCVNPQTLMGQDKVERATSCGHFCHECFFLLDSGFDEFHSDIRIPMAPKSWLYDIYRQNKFPEAVFTEVMRDLGNAGDA